MVFELDHKSQSQVQHSKPQLHALPPRRVFFTQSSSFIRPSSLKSICPPRRASLLVRSLLVGFTLIFLAITAPMMVAQKVKLSVEVSKTGAKIDRNIFGQFAEHLGHGVYEGIWVGPDSKIPNTRGIRNDVVGALKAIKVLALWVAAEIGLLREGEGAARGAPAA